MKPRFFPPSAPPRRCATRTRDLLATAVLLLDPTRAVVYANPAAENLFELSRRQLVGHTPRELFGDAPALDAGDRQGASPSGASYTEQELELGVAGKPRLHLTCTVSPVDAHDATLLLEFRHIDQQLKIAREERLLEQQQANRELIRSLAHEIKNPLGGIRGAAQLLERELDRPPLIEYTQVIIGEADRLQSLVNRLLTPHRLPTYRRTNIHEILVRVRSVVQAEFPHDRDRARDFDISLPEFDADPEQLTQAVLNIVRNAAQALERHDGGSARSGSTTRVARDVTLASGAIVWRSRSRSRTTARASPNRFATGSSIRWCPAARAAAGSASRIAQTFVAQHNGTIECESAPGRTVFTILLPLEFERAAAR